MFNRNNTEWEEQNTSLILGQPAALLDSINRQHPRMFQYYKEQKEADWQEDEINLESSRLDFESCPEDIYGAMVENLAYQWEADSIAVNSYAYLLTPFITDSDFRLFINKLVEIEGLHGLTYSEVGRLCFKDPKELFNLAMNSEFICARMGTVERLLEELKQASCNYSLGNLENDQELYNKAFMGLLTFYVLERVSFMSSFAHTFSIVKAGYFKGVGDLVQKIMQDERWYHCEAMKYAIQKEMFTDRGMKAYMECLDDVQAVLEEARAAEHSWNAHIFSKYSIPNETEDRFNKWVDYNVQDVYKTFMLTPPFEVQDVNPLPYMDDYLDLNKFQNANQESDNNNYSLNSFVNDIPQGKVFGYF